MVRSRRARMGDLAEIALGLPEVTSEGDTRPSYAVHGKAFVVARGPRKDAVGEAGERLVDVLYFRVADAQDKLALLSRGAPWFTTPHFNGYPAVLLRESQVGEVTRAVLEEVVVDAWLAVAPATLRRAWLAEQP